MPDSSLSPHLWLRAETKQGERRTALVPRDARSLVEAGFRVTVEKWPERCFPDGAYVEAGCDLAEPGSWPEAPRDAFILGLKELPAAKFPLEHTHVYFAHAYKNQAGWESLLSRFVRGKGTLLDIEYLVDETGHRVVAFGRAAGFAGCALGLDAWALQQVAPEAAYPPVEPFPSADALVHRVKARLETACATGAKPPRVAVIGARGRSGQGAMRFLTRVGLAGDEWTARDTKGRGPIPELLDYDVLVNCVLVTRPIPPFLDAATIRRTPRRLGMVSDVACDPSSPVNPLPIYGAVTTLEEPVRRLLPTPEPLDLTAIDHLPSLLPVESSDRFSRRLAPHLCDLGEGSPVWERARKLFFEKTAHLR